MYINFKPLASSSKGNSTYISTNETSILIDAGLTCKRIIEKLNNINVDISTIDAIFLTHEHSDHTKGIGVISRKYNIPIYATSKTIKYILDSNKLGDIDKRNINIIYPFEKCVINDICLTPFDIPHDASQPVGYLVQANGFNIGVATDFGHATEDIKYYLKNLDILLLESNYDEKMLLNGQYPYHLKRRIKSDVGHLSNIDAGNLLCDIYSKKLKYVFLGHLSDENNSSLVALETVKSILDNNNIKYNIDNEMNLLTATSVPLKSTIKLSKVFTEQKLKIL